MHIQSPWVDIILEEFFEDVLADQKRVARGRTIRVRNRLVAFVDERIGAVLPPEDLVLLGLERQFNPAAGVAQVARAAQLVMLLADFVAVENLLPVRLDARAQVRLVRELLLSVGGLYDRRALAEVVQRVYRQLRGAEAHLGSWLMAEQHAAALRAQAARRAYFERIQGRGPDPPASA
ncbi:hypothetical protein GCM10027052_22690 [Parafrigoribacterium mesophilum]|uniref:hypothetical protein n=1 Tax=Parafrigoribacterium mesophilum TaxID=433646 RepID=UPI0031FDE093